MNYHGKKISRNRISDLTHEPNSQYGTMNNHLPFSFLYPQDMPTKVGRDCLKILLDLIRLFQFLALFERSKAASICLLLLPNPLESGPFLPQIFHLMSQGAKKEDFDLLWKRKRPEREPRKHRSRTEGLSLSLRGSHAFQLQGYIHVRYFGRVARFDWHSNAKKGITQRTPTLKPLPP